MSFSITYNRLFEVQVLHHYFLNNGRKAYDTMTDEEKGKMINVDIREVITITPTDECIKKLKAHRCFFKATSSGFVVGIQAVPDPNNGSAVKPFVSFDDDLTFSFKLTVRDVNFMNYTALPLNNGKEKVYVFRNIQGSQKRKFPSITAIAPLYKPATEYLPGDMLVDDGDDPGELYTAILKTTNNTATSGEWLKEKRADKFPMHYANVNDCHRVVCGFYHYKVTEEDVEPTVSVTNPQGVILLPDVKVLSGDFRILQIDLRDYPAGFYSVHVETIDHSYVDDVAFYLLKESEIPFGIIDLSVKSDAATYNMLDNNGFLSSPTYELRFRNRSTHWRYIGNLFSDNSVTESLPLTRFGVIEAKVNDKDGNEVDDLPNPGSTIIKTEALVKQDEKKFYSEIFIH